MPFFAAGAAELYLVLSETDHVMKVYFVLLAVLFSITTMAQKKLKYLALGDSYTIGESVEESQRWPVQLVQRFRENGVIFDEPKIIATTGWRTDDLKRAIVSHDLPRDYDLVSLLIGVNNQYQGKSASSYASEFEELLQLAISFAGGDVKKVFVVSIPDYGYTPFGEDKQEKISQEIDVFNRLNKSISDKHGAKYFYITDLSRRGLMQRHLVAQDGLHPSGEMYSQWVELIMKGFQ